VAEDAVDDRSPEAPPAVVAPEAVHQRHTHAVDVIAELREQRREHGQRTEQGNRDHRHRRDAERGEVGAERQQHAGHCDQHGDPGDEH
jgi:hypothetical protein